MTVEIDDLEFDDCSESVFQNTYYKGEPFTGTAIDNREDGGYEEWHFVDGYGEGRCFATFPNGQLQEECYLHHGNVITEKEWNSNGILILNHTEEPYLYQEYYKDGTHKRKETKEFYRMWYPSGALKQEFIFSQGYSTQYAQNGTWLYRLRGDSLPLTLSRDYLSINEEYVSLNYLNLLISDRKFMWYFLLWLPKKPESNDYEVPTWVSDVICNMIDCEDLHVKKRELYWQGSILLMQQFLYWKEKVEAKRNHQIFLKMTTTWDTLGR